MFEIKIDITNEEAASKLATLVQAGDVKGVEQFFQELINSQVIPWVECSLIQAVTQVIGQAFYEFHGSLHGPDAKKGELKEPTKDGEAQLDEKAQEEVDKLQRWFNAEGGYL